MSSIERICFQIEQAHWFYEDFVREESPHLPSFTLKQFSNQIFKHCLILHKWANDHETAFANFIDYKIRVPVCGAIILNEKLDKALLVKGYKKGSTWGFPKGKINKDEPEGPCAVREVEEEIGFDVGPYLKEDQYLERVMRGQRIRLFIVTNIPESTPFAPQTRKEISDIKWHRLVDLPGWIKDEDEFQPQISDAKSLRYYLVTSFVMQLKQWIIQHKKDLKTKRRKENKIKSGNNTDSESGYRSSDRSKRNRNKSESKNKD